MSDFFSNLASRARAAEPALRPNLALHFEPPREVPPAAGLNVIDAETEPAAPTPTPSPKKAESRRPELPAATTPDRIHAEPEASEPTLAGVESQEIPPGPAPTPATRRETQPPKVLPVEESPAALPESASPHARAAALRQPDAAPTPGTKPQVAAPPDDSTRDESENELATLAEPRTPTFDATKAEPAPTPGSPATDTTRAFPTSLTPVRPWRVSRSQAQTPVARGVGVSDSTSAPDLTPPMVHVTIGRLEIRAITPQTPPPGEPRVAAGPRLSLDEYLRRNHGGA